jgi:hypothetical protein
MKPKPYKRSPIVAELVKRRLRLRASFAPSIQKDTFDGLESHPALLLFRRLTKQNAPDVVAHALRECIAPKPNKYGDLLLRRPPHVRQSCNTNLGDVALIATHVTPLSIEVTPAPLRRRQGRLLKLYTPAGVAHIGVYVALNGNRRPVVVFRHWTMT